MTINSRNMSVTMGVREGIAWLISVSAAMAALSTWLVLPHRMTANEQRTDDLETRVRVLERIDSQLAEMKADIRIIRAEINAKRSVDTK